MKTFFYEGQSLNLPSAAESLNLSSSEFKVVKVMGGGMGVCAKICASNGNFYALKVIYLDLLDDKNALARYVNEVKTWMTLSACDGIAEAFCIEQVNEVPCVISRWMEGGDLTAYISSKDKMFFFRTMERIVLSLKWAYDKHRYIHRDLKPANILLDEKNNAYVADWGLAKDLAKHISIDSTGKKINTSNPELTSNGSFLGTVSYASPEQILGKKDVDFRSDIYSLGCLMYEWETGQRPFDGKTCEEIAYSQVYTKPKKIGGFLVTTNFGIEKIILRCLEKLPTDRYQSYDDLLVDIRKAASKSCKLEPQSLKERYNAVKIGYDEFCSKLNNKEFRAIYGTNGVAILSEQDIQPYLWEASKLLALSEWQKAIDVLERLYAPQIFQKFPNMGLHQFVAINISLAYCRLHRYDDALCAIHSIDNADSLCVDYYVNLSCILIEQQKCIETRDVCLDGLKKFPKDKDLQGNLTLAYVGLDELNLASQSALKRLDLQRDLSALMEAAMVSTNIAEEKKNYDFPSAIKSYINALSFYKEAEYLNPTQVNVKRNIANILFKLKRYADSNAKIMEVNKLVNGSTAIDTWYIARNLQWACPPNECKSFCEKWLKVFPDDERLNTMYTKLLFEDYCLGQYKDGLPIVTQQCIDFLNRVTQGGNKITDVRDYILAARILFWISNGDVAMENQAIEMLEEQRIKHPKAWSCDFYLASFYASKKDFEESIKFIEFAIKKAPWREGCYMLASQVYSACGKLQEALSCQQKATSLKEQKRQLYKSVKDR